MLGYPVVSFSKVDRGVDEKIDTRRGVLNKMTLHVSPAKMGFTFFVSVSTGQDCFCRIVEKKNDEDCSLSPW